MKKFAFLLAIPLLFACTANDDSVVQEEVDLIVNHFKSTAVLELTTVLLIQEQTQNRSGEFTATRGIRGFDFQPGFIYDLTVVKTTTKNPGTEFRTVSYELVSENSRTQVPKDQQFSVPLAQNFTGVGYSSWITGNLEFGFYITGEIPINCALLCPQLDAVEPNQAEATGVFVHGDEGEYVLIDLY